MNDDGKRMRRVNRRASPKAFPDAAFWVSGISLSAPLVLGPKTIRLCRRGRKIYGPGKVPISLTINSKKHSAEVEPRATLLDTLRNELELTGAARL
jgi:hypothetical protein